CKYQEVPETRLKGYPTGLLKSRTMTTWMSGFVHFSAIFLACVSAEVVGEQGFSSASYPYVPYETATFAGGKFHDVEARFGCTKGVLHSRVGWISIIEHKHPHATPKSPFIGSDVEAVELHYDPKVVSYSELLDIFWGLGNHKHLLTGPLGLKQFASAIYCHTDEQLEAALTAKIEQEKMKGPYLTEVLPSNSFLEAPSENQKYHLRRREKVFASLNLNDEETVSSSTAMLLNAYIAGQCSRPWKETEKAIKGLQLSIPQLETMGLEALHPNVIVVPRFGQESSTKSKG
ncbi:hypothetical protein CYMTET_33728, partial [Cymbomonas tetramitiformis]